MKYYFDNAATTFPKPPVVTDVVAQTITTGSINAGRGVYDLALAADQTISRARSKVCHLLGHESGEVLLMSSVTLALNQIIQGLPLKAGDNIYTTPFEHNSVARVVQHIADFYGLSWRLLAFDSQQMKFDIDQIKTDFFQHQPTAVIMSHVSNVFGIITPIEQIGSLAKKYGSVIAVDGAQGGPLLPCKDSSPVDFYAFSGHKTFYGPFGVAGFWTNNQVKLKPILFGGTGSHSQFLKMPEELPYQMEVGSHNIVAIAGLEAACDWLNDIGCSNILKHEQGLMTSFVNGLQNIDGYKFWFADIENHVGVISILLNGYGSQELAMVLNQEYGIAVRAGLHCAPMAHDLYKTTPGGTVRVSFGWFNTEKEVEELLQKLAEISESL